MKISLYTLLETTKREIFSLGTIRFYHGNRLDIINLLCISSVCISLVADRVVFNSQYNMDAFLGNINTFMGILPDYRPRGLPEAIRPKCRVLYYPIEVPTPLRCMMRKVLEKIMHNNSIDSEQQESVVVGEGVSNEEASSVCCERNDPLHIVWPHRW